MANPYFMMPHPAVPMQMQQGMQGMQQSMQGMQQMGPRPPYNLLRPTMPAAMPMPRPFMPMQINSSPTVLRPPGSLLVKPPTPAQNPSTIYVGRIPEDCEDEFITNILLTCGQVTKWKRLADPDSGKLKSFGFCEYDSPLSALRALRLLKNLEIGDSKLLLNVDTKTQEMLDAYDNAYKNSQSAQQDEAALLVRIRQMCAERAITHPPKPKEETLAPAPVPASDEQSKEKEGEKQSGRKRDKGSRSRSREKRRKSRSRSRSRERSNKRRSSRDRRGSRSSRTRDRRHSRSRSRSRGRRDRKGRRHSRSRSPRNSESPKRKKKSKAKAKSDSEESGTEKENNQAQEDDSPADEEPPPPPPAEEDQNNSKTVENDRN